MTADLSTLNSVGTASAYAAAGTGTLLKMFAGEVIKQYNAKTVMKNLVRTRVISSGKSAAFPVTGLVTSKYHLAGEDLLDGSLNYTAQPESAEKQIFIDRMLTASIFLDNLHEKMLHYDIRSEYSHQMGEEMARRFDVNAMISVATAARSAANLPSGSVGGSGVTAPAACTNANLLTSGADLLEALFACAQRFDENKVPDEDRHAVIRPVQYYNLVKNQDLLNRDFGGQGNGVFHDGTVFRAAGIALHKSVNLPTTNLTDATNEQDATDSNDYTEDFTNNAGLVFHTSAVGVVRMADLMIESQRYLNYLGDLLVAHYAVGHGVLRPEAAIELRIAV